MSPGVTNPLTTGFAKKQREQEIQITTVLENTADGLAIMFELHMLVFPTPARLTVHLKIANIWTSAECAKWAFC